MPLTIRQRATLESLCRRIAPAAYEIGEGAMDLESAVEQRLENGDPVVRKQIALLLGLFDSRATYLLFGGRPRRFSGCSAKEQDEWLRSWEGSAIGPRRAIFQAFRRLVLSTFYAQPAAWRRIGYLGPFYSRKPVLPWEGALPGTTDDAEPVARGASRSDAWKAQKPAAGGITQGRDMPRQTNLWADVCVIGSGAGGAVAAARLAEAGYKVVLLEEGGYWTASDFTEDEAQMVPRLYADAAGRATDDLSVVMLQGRCVGGGTTVNWLIMLRTPEWVLSEWASEHGCEGMSAEELAPVFDLIEDETHARVVPDDAHSPNNRIVLDGARALGWRARPAAINARECVRSGFCGLGCRYGAKQSTLVTYIPRALAAGGRLFSDVRVERIEIVERNRATMRSLKRVHGTVLDPAKLGASPPLGNLQVEAPIVVLAAGAVGTPAILQRSGLAGGGVGKFLRLHPTSAVLGIYDREMYGAAGIPLSVVCDEFLRSGENGYGSWIECAPMLPGLASIAIPGFGADHGDAMRLFPHLGALIVLARDGADKKRSNGEVRVDRRGRPHIHYRLSSADRTNLVEGLKSAARLHLASGASEVRTGHSVPLRIRTDVDILRLHDAQYGANQLCLFSAHVNGTCRIGTNPRTSGCGPNGERHGVKGLYVADGSLLPTAPGVNPQETIMALATVVSRRIMEEQPQ
ncbi:MAG: GMC family oxidoreductase N-terminal domain-containing protein [Gemmatimonadaceae bacterium]